MYTCTPTKYKHVQKCFNTTSNNKQKRHHNLIPAGTMHSPGIILIIKTHPPAYLDLNTST